MQPAPAFDDLPESVRTAAIALAAQVISRVPADALPAVVRPLVRFAPAKRARHGAAPLARALAVEPSFRSLIASHIGQIPDGDPALRAACYYLQGDAALVGLLDEVTGAEELAGLQRRVAELTEVVERLGARLAAATEESDRSGDTPESSADPGEPARLRQRLRKQGTAHRQALDALQGEVDRARTHQDAALATVDQLQKRVGALEGKLLAERNRAEAAETALVQAREGSAQQRLATDRRLSLLLDTLVEAASGLRREWRLLDGGALPADIAAAETPARITKPARPLDPALALTWLGLPHAHLIVDGYNITKLGYPDLTLAQQRDRLVRAVGGLVARTGVEATVVFDGAAVVAASPSTRAVRVLFSAPGVIADDLIRELVAAEPSGRVVVVATSDREIVDDIRRRGARAMPAPVFLELL